MNSSTPSLYDRIGGKFTINAAIDRFYEKIFGDERLKVFFKNINLERQIEKQKYFMSIAFGGPVYGKPRDMRAIHAPLLAMGLNDTHVDIFLEHFRATLQEIGVRKDLIEEALSVANSYRDEVLNR